MSIRHAHRVSARATSRVASTDEAHRPDIDGLRAVAVALVVLFHASIGDVPGGFVGVDVFFVLSGFLITGLLLRELDTTGTISLTAFYARRVRRLLPAAALVLLVTLVVSIAVLPPLLVPAVAGDAAAAAAYVSNIGFAVQATDYFASGQAPSPLLHYWSLGVEEQFYLFWPALLLVVAGRQAGRGRRIALTVVLVSVVSFILAVWLTSANPPWAFFSLPTRSWELGLGAMIALAGTRLGVVPSWLAAIGAWLGLAMIVVAGMALDETVPFPGLAALLPTLGTGLVLIGGAAPVRWSPGRPLGAAVPRFIGRISYSLYLWHWPVLVIPAVALGTPLPLWSRFALVGLAVVLAAATQRLVEEPLRVGRLIGTRPRRNLAAAGALTVAVAIVSVSVSATTAASLAGDSTPGSAGTPTANAQSVDDILNALAGSPAVGAVGSVPASAPPEAASVPSTSPASRTPSSRPVRSTSSPSRAVASSAPVAAPSAAPPSASPLRPAATINESSAPTPVSPSPPTAAPSPTPSDGAPFRPPAPDGPVPANLLPSIGMARSDYPEAYLDGCHTQMDGHADTGTCLYGDLNSTTTVALFGDSHALAWFPAVEAAAQRHGWRLLSLTMSTCSPADILIWVPDWKRVSTECSAWREQTVERLVKDRPDVILVAGTRGFATVDASGNVLAGDARTQAWEAGMQRTLDRLVPAAARVMVIADTPLSRIDPPVCLSQHPNSVLACATSVADATNPTWLDEEHRAADAAGAAFIDPSLWVCPTSPCPVVLGRFMIYRDAGHLTATFSQALGDRLGSAIALDMAAPLGRPSKPLP